MEVGRSGKLGAFAVLHVAEVHSHACVVVTVRLHPMAALPVRASFPSRSPAARKDAQVNKNSFRAFQSDFKSK